MASARIVQCGGAAPELTVGGTSAWQAEPRKGQEVQSFLLSKLGCLLTRSHIVTPALPST